MKITTVGIDLAKNVIQIHGVDERGKTVLRKQLKRAQVASFFATLEPCLIGMEACGSAHHWARKLQGFGHTVRLMAPQFVKPYVKTNKNDVADAEAICEAVGRPNMRFVPLKTTEQQGVLALHRARQGFVKARTAQANAIRGLLGEFGIVIAAGDLSPLAQRVPEILEDGENGCLDRSDNCCSGSRSISRNWTGRWASWSAKFKFGIGRTRPVASWRRFRALDRSRRSALVASVGDAKNFANGRQMAAWLGLVPRQHSSGGKPTLLGISKRGDCLFAYAARPRGQVGSPVRSKARRTRPADG